MEYAQSGGASKTVQVYVRNSSTGAPLTGLVFNTAGLTAYYARTRSTPVAITLATLAGANAAYSSGGFVALDGTNMPGFYRLDLPDAAIAAGVDGVVVSLQGAADMEPVGLKLELVDFDPQNMARDITDAGLRRDWTEVATPAARSTMNALRILRNRHQVAAGTLNVYEEDDTTSAWAAAVTSDGAAQPITQIDPT